MSSNENGGTSGSNPEPKPSPEAKLNDAKPTKTVKPPKKQWNNPALRMMGIPRFSLPSRNWMIFWSVLASIGGGIAYDKYEQKQIRQKWMKEVEKFSGEIYASDRIPRKLTIFIAPPPNDFLDESLKYFKRFIKPVLNASAVDYEVFTENRQGDIRSGVAEKIRQLRKERSEAENPSSNETKDSKAGSYSWFQQQQKSTSSDNLEEPLVNRQDLYKTFDVLGLYKIFKPIKEVHRDDEVRPEEAGGVICIGRGAYKEYLTGVHEGLLGPLEKPEEIKVESDETNEGKTGAEFEVHEEDEDEEEKRDPVPKPFILPADYAKAEFAPELNSNEIIRNNKNVPVLFEQPVYVFPVPNILGFLNIPRKIYRFYTKRFVADDFGERTSSIVENKSRPFEYKDTFMAKEEELDWPKKWVQKGKEKGSEWVQELVVDERITSRMKVFIHEGKEK